MDELLKEIERKKANLSESHQKIEKKYVKRGEIEKLRQEEYLKRQREMDEKRDSKKVKVATKITNSKPDLEPKELVQPLLDRDEVKKRLRAHKQPITLFGESDGERSLRLKKVESVEERSKAVTFKSLFDANEQDLTEDLLKGDQAETVEEKDEVDTTGISVELLKNDKDFGCELILAYFKRLFRQWERKLQSRPDDVKRSTKGKLQSINLAQAGEHLKPFWEGLERRDLAMDILIRIAEVCKHLQSNAFHRANDTYIRFFNTLTIGSYYTHHRLSIGNAPWPIGVTGSGKDLFDAGMHARVGDDKIRTDEVAHVLNDETTRKWIQSVKRLMTFAEESYLESKND